MVSGAPMEVRKGKFNFLGKRGETKMAKIEFKDRVTKKDDKAVIWATGEIEHHLNDVVKSADTLAMGSSMRYEREFDPDFPYLGPTTIIGFDIIEGMIGHNILNLYKSSIRTSKKGKDGYLVTGAPQNPSSDKWYYLYVVVRKNSLSYNCVEEN
jgi:hypothetical protein